MMFVLFVSNVLDTYLRRACWEFLIIVYYFSKFIFLTLNRFISEFILFFQVFSAFGFVHKITTFEKTAGFQVFMLQKMDFSKFDRCQ